MREIPIGVIKLALEEHGQSVGDYEDSGDFCRIAPIAFGEVLKKELQKKNGGIDSDDRFTIGLFVIAASNYITAVLNVDFETVSLLTLLDYYRDCEDGDRVTLGSDTVIAFNDVMSEGNAGRALMLQIAKFFEHSGEEHLAKLMALYGVFREGLD